MNAVEIKNMSYQFSRNQTILQNICLNVPQGSIYGFLGPNGAGKTTTLKLILGLLKRQTGEINFLGKNLENSRTEVLMGVGSLIEMPSLYSHLTAHENLKIWQKIYQCPQNRIQEVLNWVGLGEVGAKKTGQFSLGMKQRMGIAVALLQSPKLLILDEPTNGLDPNGMIEMRELFQKLNQECGITILISSHLLSEIEKLATHIGIIHQGKMLFEGTLEKLTKMQQKALGVKIRTDNTQKALELLQDYPIRKNSEYCIEIQLHTEKEVASIVQILVAHQISVYEASLNNTDLETIFMNLIN